MELLVIALIFTAILCNWRRKVWKYRAKLAALEREEMAYQVTRSWAMSKFWQTMATGERVDVLEAEVIE